MSLDSRIKVGTEFTAGNRDIPVERNEGASRFQVEIEGELAFLEYEEAGKRIILVHTEVPPNFGRRGIASRIVKAALDYASEKNLIVVPICPFVVAYIRKHKEYLDLVALNFRDQINEKH